VTEDWRPGYAPRPSPLEDNKGTIPERHLETCRALARVAAERGLNSFSGKFRPGFRDGWDGDISFNWEQGRHGEDAGQISIWSQIHVNTKIADKENNENR
jgi:hypothetical protein